MAGLHTPRRLLPRLPHSARYEKIGGAIARTPTPRRRVHFLIGMRAREKSRRHGPRRTPTAGRRDRPSFRRLLRCVSNYHSPRPATATNSVRASSAHRRQHPDALLGIVRWPDWRRCEPSQDARSPTAAASFIDADPEWWRSGTVLPPASTRDPRRSHRARRFLRRRAANEMLGPPTSRDEIRRVAAFSWESLPRPLRREAANHLFWFYRSRITDCQRIPDEIYKTRCPAQLHIGRTSAATYQLARDLQAAALPLPKHVGLTACLSGGV